MTREDLLTLRLMIARAAAIADCQAYCDQLRDDFAPRRGLFSKLIRFDLDYASRLLGEGRYEDALRQIQLIHNLPLCKADLADWDQQHFFKVELTSYLESEPDVDVIRRHISLLGQTPATAG